MAIGSISNAQRAAAWRAANKETEQARQKASYARHRVVNPEAVLLKGARERTRLSGLPCTITKEDIIIPDVCPILGIPIRINVLGNNGGDRDHSPSLDRVVPELGYIPSNVRVISNRANRLKADNTIETLEAILKYMKD